MFRTTRRTALALATSAVAAAALAPAGAHAATSSFGSSLNHEPANAGQTCTDLGLLAPKCTHVGSYYPGTSGKARAPRTGRIKQLKVYAQGPMTFRLKVASVKNVSANHKSAKAKIAAVGPVLHAQGPTAQQQEDGTYRIETFKVNVKVKKGQELAIDTDANTAGYCADGSPYQTVFSPILKLGQNFRTNQTTDDCQLLMKAIVKS
jgi:hypothetical protein